MSKLVVKIELEVEPGSDTGRLPVLEMWALLSDYLISDECDLYEAYGPTAFGGWDGPYISAIRVGSMGCTKAATWGKRVEAEA